MFCIAEVKLDLKAQPVVIDQLVISYAIYEGADVPLETAPDPEQKSQEAINYILAGRPGMVIGKIVNEETF